MGEFYAASTKRRLLAIYIDYLIFGAGIELVWYLFFRQEPSFWLKGLFVTGWELLLFKWLGSPGFRFLSMKPESEFGSLALSNAYSQRMLVPRDIHDTERWYTMLLGVFLVLSGVKEMVRWTMFAPPTPYFGLIGSVEMSAIISIIFGAFVIWIGYLVLRLKKLAIYALAGYLVLNLVATFLGWDQWDEYAREYTIRRYEYQGRELRPGTIEFMQMLMPEMVLVMLGLLAAWAFAIRKRLQFISNP